jgi:hypothetical protein
LAGQSDDGGHEGKGLDQLDLRGQDAFVNGLLVFFKVFFSLAVIPQGCAVVKRSEIRNYSSLNRVDIFQMEKGSTGVGCFAIFG